MPSFSLCKHSKVLVFSILITAGSSAGFAQEQDQQKPDAPKPQGPPSQTTKPISPGAPYEMISGKERLHWVVRGTIGPRSLFIGLFSAGLGTAQNSPKEYGTHWDGFGKRYGLRLTGVATSNTIEASLGSIWGEDPRYVRAMDGTFKHRVKHVILLTFAARNREGELRPAYARYTGIVGSNFLSNTWRPDSVSHPSDAWKRSGYGFLGRLAGNTFSEFWPDLKQKVFKK
jgi:hypothetical protein